MRMCHLRANEMSADGLHLSLESPMETKSDSTDIPQQIKSQLPKQQALLRQGTPNIFPGPPPAPPPTTHTSYEGGACLREC